MYVTCINNTLKHKGSLAIVIATIVVASSLFTYMYSAYFSSPFSIKWEKDLGNPSIPQGMTPLIENGTFYWLGSYSSNFIPGSNEPFVIQAISLSNGSTEWKDNLTILNPGIDIYGASQGRTISTLPQLYWNGGTLILVSYAVGFTVGGHSQRMSNMSIFMARFNPNSGALINYAIYNKTYLSSGFPIVVSNDRLYVSNVQQLGETYYYNGILTGYFKFNVLSLNISDNSSWNTSFYRQGDPTSTIIPEMQVCGNTLSLMMNGISNKEGYRGNTTFSVFNATNGKSLWNYTAVGNAYNIHLSVNHLYFINSTGNLDLLDSLNSKTGIPDGSFTIGSTAVTYVQDRVIVQQNETFAAYSLGGNELWNTSLDFLQSPDSYTSIMGLSSGFMLISSPGSHSYYVILNMSSGDMIWSKTYASLSVGFLHNADPEIPVLFHENYLICDEIAQTGGLTVVASNLAGTI